MLRFENSYACNIEDIPRWHIGCFNARFLMTFAVSLSISTGVCLVAAEPSDWAAHEVSFADEEFNWQQVDSEQRVAILQMLADQCAGNYGAIQTWKGVCNVRLTEFLSEEYVANELVNVSDQTPSVEPTALTKLSDFSMSFVIDSDTGSIHRSKETRATEFSKTASAGSTQVELPHIGPADESSVVTAEHYLHVSPKEIVSRIAELPDHPEAANKRVAYREPTERSENKHLGDLVDPRDFFSFSRHTQLFDADLRSLAAWLQDANSRDTRSKLDIYQSHQGDGTWYRIDRVLAAGQIPMYSRTVWSPEVGYHPIRLTFHADSQSGRLRQRILYTWQQVDGVYVPSTVKQAAYRENGNLAYKREVRLDDQVVNGSIDEDQFTYTGIGLHNRDLVVDNIENAVYIMESGKPIKLANFGEKYVPPEQRLTSARSLLFFANIVVIVALLCFVLWRKKTSSA